MPIGDLVVVLATVGVWLFCLVDVIATPTRLVRHLRKGWWILIVAVFGAIGAAAWLVIGRPGREARALGALAMTEDTSSYRPKASWGHLADGPRVLGPDDDPEFLARIRIQSSEEKELLSWWEADLRRRGDDRPNGDSTNGLQHEG
jgi:hypothetical protein